MASFIRKFLNLPGLSRNYDLLPPSPTPSPASSIYHLPQNNSDDVELGPSAGEPRINRRLIFRAMLQLATLFLVGSIILGGTLYLALPPLDETDQALLHVPTSFDELKALNTLLKKLKLVYPIRTVVCFIVTYLYLQAFSLPGSMYLSILAGAVWGMPLALPLCCLCVATGATLCYLLSACFGPALFAVPKFKSKIDQVAQRMDEPGHRENLIPYMIVLRMAPLPPHWALNLACPHLGIGIVPFWISAFLGIMGVSVIHTTIGGGLDQMTSSDDFHLISWGNFFGLAAVVGAVCVPIVLRWKWQTELREVDGTLTPPRCGMTALACDHRTIPRIVVADARQWDGPVGSLGLVGVAERVTSEVIYEPWSDGRTALDNGR